MKDIGGSPDTDGIRHYMKIVEHYPVLKVGEERLLARTIAQSKDRLSKLINALPDCCRAETCLQKQLAGMKLDASSSTVALDIACDTILKHVLEQPNGHRPRISQAIAGNRRKLRSAFDRMMLCNLKLVISVTKARFRKKGGSLPDMIQEGIMALMKGVDKFEYKRGNKFSTYAVWWIRQGYTRAYAETSRTIRLPEYQRRLMRRLIFFRDSYRAEHGLSPSNKESAEKIGIRIEDVELLMHHFYDTQSTESPMGTDEDSSTLGQQIENTHAERPDANADLMELRKVLKILFPVLSPREQLVLKRRFGIDDDRVYSLKEIGETVGTTRERVRQLEAQALRKLRNRALKLKIVLPMCLSDIE